MSSITPKDRINIVIHTSPNPSDTQIVKNVKVYSGITATIMTVFGKAEITQVNLENGKKVNLCLNKRSLAKHTLQSQGMNDQNISDKAKDVLANKLLVADESGKTEFSSINSGQLSVINELKLGLCQCSEMESSKILSKTNFIKHSIVQDGLMNLTPDIIKKAGLVPQYQMTVLNQTFTISKIFTTEEHTTSQGQKTFQYNAIAYVQDPKNKEKFIPRLIYRSGADNIWRIAPVTQRKGVSGPLNIGKGWERTTENGIPGPPIRDTTNAPFELNRALAGMLDPKLNALILPKSTDQLNHNWDIANSIPMRTKQVQDKNSNEEFRKAVRKPRQFDVIKSPLSPEDAPDFSKGIRESFTIPGTNSGDVTVFRVLSQNKKYEYVFYEAQCFGFNQKYGDSHWKEMEPRPWLASVHYIGPGQSLTSFLTYRDSLDLELGTLSGADRRSYIEQDESGNYDWTPHLDNVDMGSLQEANHESRNTIIADKLESLKNKFEEEAERMTDEITAVVREISKNKKDPDPDVREKSKFRPYIESEYRKGNLYEEQAIQKEVELRKGEYVRNKLKKEKKKLDAEESWTMRKVEGHLPKDTELVPTWNLRKNYFVIQEFQKWRQSKK